MSLREACQEWLDERSGKETTLEDLVLFVQAQRLAARRDMLEHLSRVLQLDPYWAGEALNKMRDEIEAEATS